MSKAAYSVWLIWLTEDRLARWNALRERAEIAPISRVYTEYSSFEFELTEPAPICRPQIDQSLVEEIEREVGR